MNKPDVIVLPDWATRYMALEAFFGTIKKMVEHRDRCWHSECHLSGRAWNNCKNPAMCVDTKKRLMDAITKLQSSERRTT